jgi:soluble lytic murein transglycosylase-like protein
MRLLATLCVLMSVCRGSDSTNSAARAAQEASVAKQRASVRAQQMAAVAQDPSFFVSNVPEPGPEIVRELVPPEKIREIVDDGAKQSGLDANLVRAVVRQESAYNPWATSPKGAQGLMQLMPSVQAQFGVTDPYDPKQNVGAGTRRLKQLLERFDGDLPRALGAYNAGPARVEQWGGVPPFPETMQYVTGILSELGKK